jgi:hypothetical protein
MMRTTAIPFLGRPPAPAAIPSIRETVRALRRILLTALDRLVPPHDPGRDPQPPPEWYRFPPF